MWSTFLTRHDLLNKDKLPLGLNDPALKKALGVLEVMNFKGDERQAYEEHLKWLMIEANTLRKYEAKGFAEGKAKGITEGMEKGREEGEKKKAIAVAAIAKNMLAKGMDLETTSSVTGLSIEEISQL